MNKYFKLIFSLILTVTIISLYSHSAYAVVQPDIIGACKPEELIYQKSVKIYDLDIRRTVDNFVTSIFVSMFGNVAGLNPDAVMGCQSYIYDKMKERFKSYDVTSLESLEQCAATDAVVCEELAGDLDNSGISQEQGNSVEVMAVRSSLLGFSNLVEGTVRNEPLPVNLAYYWDQSISNIPYLNKALASPGDAYENLPMVKASYELWAMSVRVALGLMSAILLFTGIMIVMGKKVNQQLVVSVQYAIPKIIISIFLIIFSYPIGATIASISWGLWRGAFPLVFDALLGRADDGTVFPSGMLVLMEIITTLRLAQGGFFYVLVVLIVALLLLILRLVIFFKAFFIYIKMIFSIMTAPLEFALGAVPGSEARVKDWFLRMAKYGLTIFGMGIVIPATLIFGLSIMIAYTTGSGAETGGWGILIGLVTPLIAVVLGFGLGINMEKHVNNMFGGGKPVRK